MKKEPKGLNELAKDLDQLKKANGTVDDEIGSVHFDSLDPQDVERAIGEWEQRYKAKVAPYCSDPAVRELVEGLMRVHRKSLMKQAEEARKKPPAPGTPLIH